MFIHVSGLRVICFLSFWGFMANGFSQEISQMGQNFPAGEITEKVLCQEEPDRSYALYLPKGYDPKNSYALVLIFEPISRATLPLEKMQQAADHFGIILACSWDTYNMNDFRDNIASAKAMWMDVATRFSVDTNRTYTSGFSGGARLASEIAIVTGTIAGHIGCGAGLRNTTHTNKTIPFSIALVIGNQDMNVMELTDLDRKLSFTKSTHRLFIFEGGHEWPSPEVFMEVFGWLNVQAMRSKLLPHDAAFIQAQWEKDLNEAQRFINAQDYLEAQRLYERMAHDYITLRDTTHASDLANELRKNPDYKEGLQRKMRLENAEKMRQRRYVQDLRKQGSTLPSELEEYQKLLRPWIQEKQRQDEHILKTKFQDERLMAQRLIDFAWRMSIERSMNLYASGSYREALFLALLSTVYVPEYSYPFILVAKCYAQLDSPKEALIFLERALDLGVNQPERLAEDPAFVKLYGSPKYQELFKGD